MERRFLLFLAVSFLIVTVWARIFVPEAAEPVGTEGSDIVSPGVGPSTAEPSTTEKEAPGSDLEARRPGPERETSDPKRSATPEGSGEDVSAEEARAPAVEALAALAEERLVVDTGLLRVELTNEGARIVSATLAQHEDADGRPYELVARRASELAGIYPLDVALEDGRLSETLRAARFQVEGERKVSLEPGESSELVFRWADGRGLEAEKRLVFTGGEYVGIVTVSVTRDGRELEKQVLVGAGLGVEVSESRYMGREKGVLVDLSGEVRLVEAGDVAEGEGRSGAVSAAGIASHYFAGLMLPLGEEVYGAELSRYAVPVGDEGQAEREVIAAGLRSTRGPATFELYLGPKKLERLEALRPELSQIIELGWMRVPALLLRAGLMRIYEVVRNYGWAIVLLTFLINLLLVPLKHYSFVSMRRMQKLAPQIQHIKDKYKKVKPTDPRYQHMNQEIMGLYKEHNVNPISGCLPMLLMIPFFFAFYRLLMASIELRHAPFMGWIQDLSAYDPLFVLPILMGVSQVAIQRMTPQTTADPVQAKIMQFMPIMFTFILAWAPAGLVLYWFSNNLVSMGQQVVTNRYLKTQDEKAGEAQKAAIKSKKRAKKQGRS